MLYNTLLNSEFGTGKQLDLVTQTCKMALRVSSHNPFRTPGITPSSTGAPVSTPLSPPSPTSPPPIPPRPSRQTTVNPTDESAVVADDTSGLLDELPPAYTPSPDTRQGESTIEFGPHRPFHSPPPRPIHQSHRPRPGQMGQLPTLWTQLTGQAPISTGSSSWSSYPGRRNRLLQPEYTGYMGSHTPSQSSSLLEVPRVPTPPPTATSEFAREFYAAGAGDAQVPYSAPPGPPPSSPNMSNPEPTTSPKPGHPLLRDGKLLVYPSGYECPKCEFNFFQHAILNTLRPFVPDVVLYYNLFGECAGLWLWLW